MIRMRSFYIDVKSPTPNSAYTPQEALPRAVVANSGNHKGRKMNVEITELGADKLKQLSEWTSQAPAEIIEECIKDLYLSMVELD